MLVFPSESFRNICKILNRTSADGSDIYGIMGQQKFILMYISARNASLNFLRDRKREREINPEMNSIERSKPNYFDSSKAKATGVKMMLFDLTLTQIITMVNFFIADLFLLYIEE